MPTELPWTMNTLLNLPIGYSNGDESWIRVGKFCCWLLTMNNIVYWNNDCRSWWGTE